jgi:hypothetical protein
MPLMPDQIPSAAPRRSGGNSAASSVSVSGAMIAPPTPCSAGGDELSAAGCERRGGGRGGEQREAGEERAPAPEPVADRRPGDQGDSERERIGVDRPLELLQRGAQVLADRRQRDGDDEVVQHDHEQRERDDREGRAGAWA